MKSKKAKDNLFKIYLDYDIVFYNLSFDALKEVNTVYEEQELYDQSIAGVSTFLRLQKPNKNDYEYYPAITYNLLNSNQKYAVVTYSFLGAFSTSAVATVQNLTLNKIEIFNHTTAKIMRTTTLKNIGIKDWKEYLEVDVKQFIEYYIKYNKIENIDSDYLDIAKTLENHEKYSRILSTVELYVNGIIHYEKNLETNVLLKMKDYRELSENDFRKNKLSIDHIEDWVFDVIFNLTIVCISGYALENSTFRKRLKIKYNNFLLIILRILFFPISILVWLTFSFFITKWLKNLYYYLFYPINGFLYLLILIMVASASYLLYKLLTTDFATSLNKIYKKGEMPWKLHSIVGFIGYAAGISSSSECLYSLRKTFSNDFSDAGVIWEISSLKVVLSTLPFMALALILFYTILLFPAVFFDKKN